MLIKYRLIFTLFILVFPSNVLFSQSRNEQVMEMNQIVKMMDEFSFVNQQAYFDAVNLHSFFSNVNHLSHPENSLFSTKTVRARQSGAYTGIEKYLHLIPEVQPDKNGMIPFYYSFFYRWLWEKEQVENLVKVNKINSEILPYLTNYMASADSLFATHKRLNDYVFDKAFQTDTSLKNAEQLLRASHLWFKTCLENSLQLDNILREYYVKNLAPYSTYPELQNGLREMELSMTLLANWRSSLYLGDLSKNKDFDQELRILNEEAIKKDSILLSSTEGYGYLSDGSWTHTRYRSFYKSMESTIFHFANSKPYTEPFMKQAQSSYNKFLLSYNQIVEDFKRYSALSDGVTYENLLVCCPERYERDTAVNVLLNRPRLLYKFEFQLATNEIESNDARPIATESELLLDKQRINQALPHHLVYLLDASASMNQSKRLSELKNNANYLVNVQREVDKITMITFSDYAEILLDAVSCDEKEMISNKIDKIHARGQTNILEGLKTVKKLLLHEKKTIDGVNSVLIISDGEFKINKKTAKIIQLLRKNKINIHLINVGKNRKSNEYIQTLVANLDVQFYDINQENLKEILMTIATE